MRKVKAAGKYKKRILKVLNPRTKKYEIIKDASGKPVKSSIDAYSDALYRANKIEIDNILSNVGSPRVSNKTKFKNALKEYVKDGLSPQKAFETLQNTITFKPIAERFRENVISALKANKEAWKAFREYTKVNGRYAKIDVSNFYYDKYQKQYIYDDIIISFKNSPYGIVLQKEGMPYGKTVFENTI